MNTPILFIVFNRFSTAAKVFAAIRKAKPAKLYIAADGPRPNIKSETEQCQQVRHLKDQVDWACELRTLYQEENLGCRHGPQAAIDWFFENEEEGIILEDDCLPHPDFFKYCQWALQTYREHKDIWQINGSNFLAPSSLYKNSNISFTALAQAWGWATWKDRWQHYQGNPYYLHESARLCKKNWSLSPIATLNKLRHIDLLKNDLNAWDFQWQVTVLNKKGLCLSCRHNLITNIGDGDNATHTANDDRVNLPAEPIANMFKFIEPKLSIKLTRWYEKHMGISSPRPLVKWGARKATEVFKQKTKNLFSSLLYSIDEPILVASSGRSGATMTADAIARSLVTLRYKTKTRSLLNNFLFKRAQAFLPRLADMKSFRQPILKTHDLFNQELSLKAKFIFIAGDPLESVQSTQQMTQKFGRIWLDEHLYHLASNKNPKDLLQEDVLNFEQQITSWLSIQPDKILILRFEEVWDRNDELSAFVGFPVQLPSRIERSTKAPLKHYNQELFTRLQTLREKRIPASRVRNAAQ